MQFSSLINLTGWIYQNLILLEENIIIQEKLKWKFVRESRKSNLSVLVCLSYKQCSQQCPFTVMYCMFTTDSFGHNFTVCLQYFSMSLTNLVVCSSLGSQISVNNLKPKTKTHGVMNCNCSLIHIKVLQHFHNNLQILQFRMIRKSP